MRSQPELAKLARKGLATPSVREIHDGYLRVRDDFAEGCFLGLSAIGLTGDAATAHAVLKTQVDLGLNPVEAFAKMLGIPKVLADEIECVHCYERVPAREIADQLERNEFELVEA